MVSQRFVRLGAALVCLLFLLVTAAKLLHGSRSPSFVNTATGLPQPAHREQCHNETEFLDFLQRPELELSDQIRYSRRCVKPIYGVQDRDVVAHVSQPLITHRTTVDLASCTYTETPPCESLELHVSSPYPVKKYPHLLFAVASGYDRLIESLPSIAHWLAGTDSHLIGIVSDADNKEHDFNLTALEATYAASNVIATFEPPRLKKFIPTKLDGDKDPDRPVPVDHHHFMLIRDLLRHVTPETQWLGILDDDTFFPSMYPLNEELSKYDHTKPFWLGALADDWNHVKQWGFMAFGGAGVFMSLPLARQIEPLLEQCISESSVSSGDGILRDCMFAHSRTRLTIVPGLNQYDLLEDASGIFESGISPLSLHHWKSWFREPIMAQAAVAALCGNCYLQRWQFGGDTVFTNGYSISMYSDGVTEEILDRIEGTWGLIEDQFDFIYGPLRPKLGEDKKKSYHLKDSQTTSDGGLRQTYVYKGNATEGRMDEVIEMMWQRG